MQPVTKPPSTFDMMRTYDNGANVHVTGDTEVSEYGPCKTDDTTAHEEPEPSPK